MPVEKPKFRMCVYHKEHETRIKRTEEDVQDIWKNLAAMQKWVIVGSGSTVLALLAILFQVVIKYL